MIPIKIKPLSINADKEVHFVLDSWAYSLHGRDRNHPKDPKRGIHALSIIKPEDFKEYVTPHIERLTQTADVLIAIDTVDPELFYGWVCYGQGVLYYIYVKEAVRRFGIGTALIQAAALNQETECAWWTPHFYGFAKHKQQSRFFYNPNLWKETAR